MPSHGTGQASAIPIFTITTGNGWNSTVGVGLTNSQHARLKGCMKKPQLSNWQAVALIIGYIFISSKAMVTILFRNVVFGFRDMVLAFVLGLAFILPLVLVVELYRERIAKFIHEVTGTWI